MLCCRKGRKLCRNYVTFHWQCLRNVTVRSFVKKNHALTTQIVGYSDNIKSLVIHIS